MTDDAPSRINPPGVPLEKAARRPRAPCTFKQCDVKRAVAAVVAAGVDVARVEVEGGKISVFASKEAPPPEANGRGANEWDDAP